MTFYRRPRRQIPSEGTFGDRYLEEDNWNDYGFYTTFGLHVVDGSGAVVSVGGVKIASTEMGDSGAVDLPTSFEQLDDQHFSLGMDGDYYENLTSLGSDTRAQVLRALRDLATDLSRFAEIRDLPVVEKSLLRSVSSVTVEGEFNRLAQGLERLLRYEFTYTPQLLRLRVEGEDALRFVVDPESRPPSNIHALIGSNGVGKTRLLEQMVRSLVSTDTSALDGGLALIDGSTDFSGIVRVSFSAFDETDPNPAWADLSEPRLRYVGLRETLPTGEIGAQSLDQLADQFATSLDTCLAGKTTSRRWFEALRELEADPLIRDIDLGQLQHEERFERRSAAFQLFSNLSSGHKIVLLIVVRLVELVEERTLVLLDEPESHLHPPLLSALIGALAKLLTDTNGVAIAATHSPVLLQEVPRSCVWILRRVGDNLIARRPSKETFGENVGDLTHDTFGLEVTTTGFYERLAIEAQTAESYDELLARFGGEVGTEARALARSLIADQDA